MKTVQCVAVLSALVVLAACGKGGGGHDPRPTATSQQESPGDDPLQEHVFPPELVMQHQGELKLTDDQQKTIVSAIQSTQGAMVDLQWKMIATRDSLFAALDADPVDEKVALDRADALFALERDVKHRQIQLLVEIRNALTPAQRTRLRELRGR